MPALWQKLSKLWRNRKPIQVPLPAALRPAAQFAGSGGGLAHEHDDSASDGLELDHKMVAADSTSVAEAMEATTPEHGESEAAGNGRLRDRMEEATQPVGLEAQMRALREEVASLASTLSSEQADRHSQLSGALKDLASHASAHNQSMVQVHEDLQLMTQTEREAVSRISELSQASERQAKAQEELAGSMRELEAKTAADYEALSAALARTRQTILAVTLIATGGMLVLIPMIVALFA